MPQANKLQKYSRMARILDEVADLNGINPRDVPGHPQMLTPYGLDPEDITPEIIGEAMLVHRSAMQDIHTRVARYNFEYS